MYIDLFIGDTYTNHFFALTNPFFSAKCTKKLPCIIVAVYVDGKSSKTAY